MTMSSSVEFRTWGALRPRIDETPAEPLKPEQIVVLRILDEAPADVMTLAGRARIGLEAYDAIERALVELARRDLAELTAGGWRRKA
jgi:hypothetical protein